MKLLIDMNLSPARVAALEDAGYTVLHWSTVGSAKASDREILTWAKVIRLRAIYP